MPVSFPVNQFRRQLGANVFAPLSGPVFPKTAPHVQRHARVQRPVRALKNVEVPGHTVYNSTWPHHLIVTIASGDRWLSATDQVVGWTKNSFSKSFFSEESGLPESFTEIFLVKNGIDPRLAVEALLSFSPVQGYADKGPEQDPTANTGGCRYP